MGTTTFTGPIQAGNILATTGTTAGVDVSNVGQVVMSQVAAITENSTSIKTTICIPAHSQILSIDMFATVAFTENVSFGISGTATYFTNEAAAGVGLTVGSPTTNTQTGKWIDTGASDVVLYVSGGNATGAGVGTVVVTYRQGPNGNA